MDDQITALNREKKHTAVDAILSLWLRCTHSEKSWYGSQAKTAKINAN